MAHEPLLTLSDNDNIAVALQKKSNPATSLFIGSCRTKRHPIRPQDCLDRNHIR